MRTLFSEDESRVEMPSPNEINSKFISVYRAGDYIPIEFDHLDYVECIDCAKGGKYRVVSHPIIVEFAEEEKPEEMGVLFSNDSRNISVHSSIDQYHKFIATYERGGWAPIEFDYLDYIECIGCQGGDKYHVVSHPIMIEFGDDIGYNFPIGEQSYTTDDYLKMDRAEVVLLPLPEFYGDGFYESYENGEIITNFDDGTALGIRNNYTLKVGKDYYLADKILPAEDPE